MIQALAAASASTTLAVQLFHHKRLTIGGLECVVRQPRGYLNTR